MTDQPEDSGQTMLDMADRKMLAEIKANVLGTASAELRIGRFRVLERLGEGSMGIVFAAADEQLQRRVAIKLLHQDVGASESERKARLFREAQILAQLEHPNIVQVYEAGEHDGQVFMAMELVEGRALDELQRTLPPGEWKTLLPLYVAAGRGLAAAHAKGVVHRDFKPHNVLVDAKGRVRVVDFGLARESVGTEEPLTAEIPLTHPGAIERPRVDHLTGSGVVPGTPAYMAPELFDGQPASAASDQFSYCVALYEAVCGRRPFEGARVRDIVAAAKHGQILPAPTERSVPKWLLEVLTRGLSARPEARFESMDALLEQLERDRLLRWKRAGMLVTAAMVIGGTWWLRGHSEPAVDVRGLLRGPDVVEEQRRDGCRAQAQRLDERWRDAKARLSSPRSEQEDASEWAAVLDADAERFVERIEGSCLMDLDGKMNSCRAQAEQAFGASIGQSTIRPLHEDLFHNLTHDLELCLEGGVIGDCGGPRPGSDTVALLGAALAAELAGQPNTALGHVEEVIESASKTRDEISRLRAMLRKGAILETRGEIDSARTILEEVMFDAQVCDVDILAFDAVLERAEAEILHFGKLQPALQSLKRAQRLLTKLGTAALPLRHARLLEKWGGAYLYLEHDCEKAIPLLQHARDLRNEVIADRRAKGLPKEHIERLAADAELNIANLGFYALTEPTARCSVDGIDAQSVIEGYRAARRRFAVSVSDPKHLVLADFDYSLGAALLAVEDFNAAIEPLESALSSYIVHHHVAAPVVGDAHRALVETYRRTGDLKRAREHAEANVMIRAHSSNAEGPHLLVAQAYDALGVVLGEQGDLDAARVVLKKAIAALDTGTLESLELNELEQLYMSELNLAMIEHDRHDRAAVMRSAVRYHDIQRVIEARPGGSPYEEHAQQRLIDAWILMDEGKQGEALERLEGIERLRGLNPVLEERVAEIRKSGAG